MKVNCHFLPLTALSPTKDTSPSTGEESRVVRRQGGAQSSGRLSLQLPGIETLSSNSENERRLYLPTHLYVVTVKWLFTHAVGSHDKNANTIAMPFDLMSCLGLPLVPVFLRLCRFCDLKVLCPGVPQNAVRDGKYGLVFQANKIRHSDSTDEHFDFATLWSGRPSGGRKRRSGGGNREGEEVVYIGDNGVWRETGKGEERMWRGVRRCTECLGLTIIIIIIIISSSSSSSSSSSLNLIWPFSYQVVVFL